MSVVFIPEVGKGMSEHAYSTKKTTEETRYCKRRSLSGLAVLLGSQQLSFYFINIIQLQKFSSAVENPLGTFCVAAHQPLGQILEKLWKNVTWQSGCNISKCRWLWFLSLGLVSFGEQWYF